jgi:curved DNA-binding protein
MNRTSGSKGLYDALGVARDADDDAIKKAYRRLAQESHPDRNPDNPAAEERFKEISQAYSVLSDAKRRSAYDEFGDHALDPNFDVEQARAASQSFGGFPGGGFQGPGGGEGGFTDFGSLFEDLLGGAGRRPRMRRGADLETTIDLDFVEAALGCERRVDLARPNADGTPGPSETLTVRIPVGVADSSRIRLAGKGGPGMAGGPAGDLLARVRVRPHGLFRREGRDIHLEAPITVSEAGLGAEFEVPTLDGKVLLRVPAGTDSGSKLRLRGKGIPGSQSATPGDLYVHIRIRVPKDLDEEARQILKDLEPYEPQNVRADFDL